MRGKIGLELRRIRRGEGGEVVINRDAGQGYFRPLENRPQRVGRALHEAGVKCSGHVQHDHLAQTGRFQRFNRLIQKAFLSGNDDLSGAVVIGDVHAVFGANRLDDFDIAVEYGGHAAIGGAARGVHLFGPLRQKFQTGNEIECSARVQRTVFAQTEPGAGEGGDLRKLLPKRRQSRTAHRVDGRLAVYGLRKFFLGAVENDLA